jgi:hypothetical protein
MADPIRLTKGVHTRDIRSSLTPGRTNRAFAARCQSRVCGVSRPTSPKTVKHREPWVLDGFGETRPSVAFPVGQTLGQTASFRQTAPETWCQSRVCGVSRWVDRRKRCGAGAFVAIYLVRVTLCAIPPLVRPHAVGVLLLISLALEPLYLPALSSCYTGSRPRHPSWRP